MPATLPTTTKSLYAQTISAKVLPMSYYTPTSELFGTESTSNDALLVDTRLS